MNTNEVLSAFNDAVSAYHRVPELERELKTITEDRDFVKLELEEAQARIKDLEARLATANDSLTEYRATVVAKNADITDLQSRNTELDRSLNDLITANRNLNLTLEERSLEIASLRLTKESLEARLEDAKGYGARLADALKSIGQKIVETVAEPEVSPAEPFPVSNPVELSVSASPSVDGSSNSEPAPVLAESTPAPVVDREVSPASLDTAPGTYIAPWWTR